MQIVPQKRDQKLKIIILICRFWEMNFRKISRKFLTMTLFPEITDIYDQSLIIKRSKEK